MKSNKKILCLFIALIMLLAVNAVCATENVSDIVASDATGSEISLSQNIDESVGADEAIVVTNQTFSNYFTADGELNDNVSSGSTLDFQGTFTGTDYKVNITKPVNIISSTGDALFNDTGKKDTAGGCFHISAGGSGTNVTDLNFINSAFYVTGASDVVIENINMMANMSGVGSGTGFMCVQAGSRNVVVKDSYFENRGTGSSIIVIGYSDYCTVENNEVFINGSSGNAVYITSYVPAKWTGDAPTGNVISNNYIHGLASGFCMALVVAGNENVIDNNIIEYDGASGIAGQSFSTQANNTYTNNILTGGCSFTAGEDSYVAGNSVEGTLTAGSNSIVEANEMNSLSLSKANVLVDNNVINDGGVTLNAAATNTTLTNNVILSPVTVKSKNNTIKNNVIDADSEYAIDLTTTTGNEVSFNTLSSNNFTGDAAVKGNENNSVHENGDLDNIVTPVNFFYFFDTEGNYRGLNYTELYFKGEFDNLVDTIIINQTLSISTLGATLNDMAFALLGDNIVLDGFEMNFDAAPFYTEGSAILIEGSNTTIENMAISYVLNESDDAYIIHAENADNLSIVDNEFFLDATTNGEDINNIIYVLDSANVLLKDNDIAAYLPSCYVDWKEIPPASGIWVKFPVSEGLVFNGCTNLTINNNEIGVTCNGVVGAYDTIYVVDIKDSQGVEFSENEVYGTGCTYIYGLYVEAEDLLVDGNFLSMTSDYYANGIEIEASRDAVISNNELLIDAYNLAYPIYSGMNGGDLEAEYINNTICADADIVYGMELCGSIESVIGNTINVTGNKTTAIASKSKQILIYDNLVNALGENLGNSTITESIKPMTVGIHLLNCLGVAEQNTINSNSRGIVVENCDGVIYDNVIMVNDNGLDDSYGILAENSDIDIKVNHIAYVGNTIGDTINNALCLKDCTDLQVSNNEFDIEIPSCYVPWAEIPAGSGNWVKAPISEGLVFDGCSDLIIYANDISVEANNVVGAYDTIYAIDITNSDNVDVSENEINGVGVSYIYGLYIEADDSLVDNNTFIIESDNYANGIEIEASINTTVSNNYFDITSPVVAYPVYSGMNGGDLEVDYINNTIEAVSDVVYGMELCGTKELVSGNEIIVNGNKTTGIAAKSKELIISNNAIGALGENLGNSSIVETFEPMTVAIHLVDCVAEIEENVINSNSRGIVVERGAGVIDGNEIEVNDNGLDDSYGILAENAAIQISENRIAYEGNTLGDTINNALCLKDCVDSEVLCNEFDIEIPSCYVPWAEIPSGSGNWVKAPISEGLVFDNCSNLIVYDNDVSVHVTDVVGAYDTIYGIDITNSDGVEVSGNEINGVGLSYIYGLYIEADDSLVDNNTFTIISDNYANGIEIEASLNTTVSNNHFEIASPNVAYPVYSGMNGGDLEVDYINNTIEAVSDVVYGMELCGTNENVFENTIIVKGNKTTGIAVRSKEAYIYKNTIDALGENLGNSSIVETFEPMTTAINAFDSNIFIEENIIQSASRGIVANKGNVIIEHNDMTVVDNALDDSYAIFAENAAILLLHNEILYEGNTDGSFIDNAIYLKDCIDPRVMLNEMDISLPSCYVDWKEVPPGSGNWVSSPVSEGIVIDSPMLTMTDNEILLNYGDVVGDYDTIYTIDIHSDGANISSNAIEAHGHSYIYGLLVSGENFTVENNTIFVDSDEFYANGIDVEGPSSGVVKDNEIENYAPGVAYPVYSAMSNGNVTVDYVNNTIYSEADLAYGMELDGLKELVEANNITVAGKEAIGIYSLSKNVTVKDNKMLVASNSTDSVAFKGRLGNATITDNNFTVMGEYTIDVTQISALVKDNYLTANELTGDASVDYNRDTSVVYNNTPKMDKYFLAGEDLEKYFGNKKQLEFILTDALGNPVANKTIIISINGANYTRITDADGKAKMNINLNSGNYTATATYSNEGYNLTADADITILSTVNGTDIVKMYRNATQYYATFLDSEGNFLANGTTVMFNINGVMYERKVSGDKGQAKLNINLSPGVYVITAYNPKSGEQAANNITVLSSIVNNTDLVKYYKNASQYVVKILDAQGNAVGAGENVTFNINGVFYTRQTDASGNAKLNINLSPGEYIITADYKGCMVSNNITVLTTLVTKDLSMKYKDGSTFNATVLDGQGKPLADQKVQFNVNGVFYYRTSGSDGIAKLNINLMPGDYIITSTYNGYGIGNKITISG